jgi:hypothetical protein
VVRLWLSIIATELARQSTPAPALAEDVFRQHIVNLMLGGFQFILRYAEFVIPFPPATVLALRLIALHTRLRLLVS